MVVNKTEMEAEMDALKKKTGLIREQLDKNYARGSETMEFKEQFMYKENEIELLFENVINEQDLKNAAKLISHVGKELQSLEKLFSVSSMFLLPKIHSLCDDLIWSLEDRLTVLKKMHLVNKRVKELEKPVKSNTCNNIESSIHNSNVNVSNSTGKNKNITNNTNVYANNNNNAVTNTNTASSDSVRIIQNNTKFYRSTDSKFYKPVSFLNDKAYTLEYLTGVALALSERVINSKKVLLSGLMQCRVKIRCALESLQILNCRNCKISVGHVENGFVKNTINSTLNIDSDKLRIEFCESTLFKTSPKSNTVVKESYNLEFAPYELQTENTKKEENNTASENFESTIVASTINDLSMECDQITDLQMELEKLEQQCEEKPLDLYVKLKELGANVQDQEVNEGAND